MQFSSNSTRSFKIISWNIAFSTWIENGFRTNVAPETIVTLLPSYFHHKSNVRYIHLQTHHFNEISICVVMCMCIVYMCVCVHFTFGWCAFSQFNYHFFFSLWLCAWSIVLLLLSYNLCDPSFVISAGSKAKTEIHTAYTSHISVIF